MRKVNNKGFSLVEILAAIVILGVLMTLAANAYNVYKKKARQQAYDTMAKTATTAATNYLMENAKSKYISFDALKSGQYIDTLQDPKYKDDECSGIVINKVIQGEEQKKLDILFQKVKLCCKDYKYQYDYTGDEVKVTEIDHCNYVTGDEIDGIYKLIFKPTGGTPCDPEIIMRRQNEEWGPLCVTTREDFVFKRWNTKKNGSGKDIKADDIVEDKDISVYAIWNEIFGLTFNEDGGSACDPKTIKKENGEKWGDLCVTTRSGYAFKGWRTKENGDGTKITKNSIAEKNLNVYAHWNPYITITFDPQGGTACNPASITKEKGEAWGTLCAPTKNGYVFKGWNTKADGTGATVTKDTKASTNMTLYAVWNPKYTLTYNSNGGVACNPATLIQENGLEWGTLCAPTRTGYSFGGWYNGSTKVTATSVCKGNLTVTAKWNPKTYTLTYENGSGCTTKEGIYDSAWGTLCVPTKTGHNFSHWSDSDGKTVTDQTICKGNKTVTANWTKKTYVLSYNDNGGSGCAGKTVSKLYQDPWGELCRPTKTGYTFSKWKNGSTEVNSSTKATDNITVTASWTANTYTLTYNNNGGSGCTSKTSKYNSGWGELCAPTKTGHTFAGWVDGNGNSVTATTVCKGDLTVRATWTENTYKLTYNNNNGSGCTSQNAKYNAAWGTLCTPTRTGYNFSHWTDPSGNQILASTICKGNVTATANWTKKTYTLTYNDNGGSGCGSKSVSKKYQETWGTLCTPTRTGYTFSKWKNGSTTVNSSSTATANIQVTAEWTANTYTLSYNNNGGSGCSSKSGTYGSNWGALCTPTKTGYSFTGWYSGSSQITTTTKVTGDLNVTAQWTAQPYTLTYNSNGGSTCNPSSVQKSYGQTWGTLCSPTKTGHSFGGWYNGSTLINQNSTVSSNITVTANWIPNTYTLSYSGVTGCSSISKTYNQAWGTLCSPTVPSGYSFGGWKNGSTTITASSKATSNITVTPSWVPNTYTLTYNNNGGSGCSSKTGTYGYAWGALCTPTKSGYIFDGWYSGGTQITQNSTVYSSLSVTAQWSASSTQTYTSGSETSASSTISMSLYAYNPDTSRGITPVPSSGNASCSFSGSYINCTISNVSSSTVSSDSDCEKLATQYGVSGTVKYFTNNEHYDYSKWASDAKTGCYKEVDHSPKTSATWTCMKSDSQNSFFKGSESHCTKKYCGYSNCLTRGWGGSGSNKYCRCWIKAADNYTKIYNVSLTVYYYTYN